MADDQRTVQLFNFETGQAENVPETSVEQAVLSGRFGLPKNKPVNVLSPEGIPGTLQPGEVSKALQSGFKYEPSQDRERRLLRKRAEGEVLTTAAEGLASGLTLGLSDKVETDIFGVDPEEIQARKDANPVTRTATEIVGAIAPSLVPGGVIGTAVKVAGAPARAAVKSGEIVANKLAKKALKKVAAESGTKSIAQKIAAAIPHTAGSAVEGSAFGLGELIKEEALGNAEFNAESLFSHAGMGAALGGGAGTVFGGFSALTPKVAEAAKSVGAKLQNTYANKGVALTEYLGMKGKAAQKVLNSPEIQQDITEMLLKHDKNILPNLGKLSEQLVKIKDNAAGKISQAYKTLDAGLNRKGLVVNRQNFYRPAINQLNEEITKRAGKKTERALVRTLKNYRDDLINLKNSKNKLTFTEMWDERRAVDSKINFKKLREEFNEITDIRFNLRTSLKNQINKTADEVGSQIEGFESVSRILKDANKDYSITSLIEPSVTSKSSKDNILGLKDFVRGGLGYAALGETGLAIAGTKKFLESDLRRKFVILGSIEKGQKVFEKALDKSMKGFFKPAGAVIKPVSTQILLKSGLSRDPNNGRRPKNKLEGYENAVSLINKYTSDPEFATRRLQAATDRVAQAAPNTALEAQASMLRAVQFLDSKIPKKAALPGLLEAMNLKIPQPSSTDLSKFEQYLEVVDNPTSVLEQLDAGTLTRENVDALQAVYPDLYEKIRSKTMEKISEDPDSLSYEKRIQVGILLDIPADVSLLPQNVLALQGNFTGPEEEDPNQGMVNPTQGGLSGVSKARRTATETQKILSEEA